MSNPYRLQPDFRLTAPGRLRAWTGALLVHAGAAAALLLAWPQAADYLEQAIPVEVRMLAEAAKPPEPPPPPPPKRPPPPPRQSAPVAPVAQPEPVVVATEAATQATMTVPPAPEPVPVQEPVPFAMPVTVPVPPAPPEPLIEARFDADYLANPKPAYPLISRRLGEQGVVHLRVHVGTDGLPLKVEVKRSSGFERLDRCAQETVTRWRFVPAKRGSNAVASWVVVPIVFSLT